MRNAVLADVVTGFAATVLSDFSTEDVLRQLVEGAVRVLDVDGAGVVVPVERGALRFSVAAGSAVDRVVELEALQEQTQSGPCRDSHDAQRTVCSGDLLVEGDWPVYREAAVAAGLRSVTAIPLVARGRTWGVLDLYRAATGTLDAQEVSAVQTLALVATSYLVVAADRDAARQAQQALAHRAMHDPLTGLPVRWVFLEQLSHALARLRRHPGHVGVLFADLDGLKYVNDTFGHEAGDQLLVTCAERIRAALRPSDVVARLGGDEFVVLLEDLDGTEAVAAVARRIQTELAAPYRSGGELLRPTASLGLAITSDAQQTPETLIAHADSAMYNAKRSGHGRYALFDADAYASGRASASGAEDLRTALRLALREGQLLLHYQPVVDLAGGAPALEALLRWEHPDRGLLEASAFVPEAERIGVMREVGAFVLAAACAQLAAWDRQLGPRAPRRLSVNVSVDELRAPDLAVRLGALLQQHALDPDRLVLEVAESELVVDLALLDGQLAAVRALGCHLALDDFGTGCSSLSRLADLPVSLLKVDRPFAVDLSGRPAAQAVLTAVLRLGAELDRAVVVQGVEDEPSLEAVRRLGGRYAQGFHLGRPAPAAQVAALLGS